MKSRSSAALLVTVAWLFGLANTLAHEIPDEVTVRVFVRPEGQTLRLLVRTPVEALRDVMWPVRLPGYLDLSRVDPLLQEAAKVWIADSIQLYEGDRLLSNPRVVKARISLPADRSFLSYEQALHHVTGPGLAEDTQIYWEQALLDVLLETPIGSADSRFSIRPAFRRLGMQVGIALNFVDPEGDERAFHLDGDPGLVRLEPNWYQASGYFAALGFFHILEGIDHLLFLLCLMIPLRRLKPLVVVVSAFTLGHSITLLAAAFEAVPMGPWFPPLIETLIAASILYMALENLVTKKVEHRWIIAFAFGLVHGFGFSFGLQESLQFSGRHLVRYLFSFNLGVEIGQLLVIVLLIPALYLLFRYVVEERVGTIILSVLIGHTAWHWMVERGSTLSRYPWPDWTAATLAAGLRWLMLLVSASALIWFLSRLQRQLGSSPEATEKGA